MKDSIVGKLKDAFPEEGKIYKYKVIDEKENIYSTVTKVQIVFEKGEKIIFLKKYKGHNNQPTSVDVGQNEFNILKNLFGKFASLRSIHVIKPIAYFSENNLLVTEAFNGESLSEISVSQLRWFPLSRKKREIEKHFFKAGEWLKAFQTETIRENSIMFDQQRFIRDVKKILKVLVRLEFKKSFEKTVLNAMDNVLKKIGRSEVSLVGCHNDFTPWNILINKGELAVIDFARFSYDSNYEDLTLFLAALEDYKSIIGISPNNIERLKEAFLDGYSREGISYHLLNLYLLKNAMKVLSWINPDEVSNTKLVDILYERFRKRRSIHAYFRCINQRCQHSAQAHV